MRLLLFPVVIALVGCHKTHDPTGPVPVSAANVPLGHHEIKVADLPAPVISDEVNNPPNVVDHPEGAHLVVPPGFRIAPWAEGNFERPRWLARSGSDVFVADADANAVFLLRDTKRAGVADTRITFAKGLNEPFGMAIGGGYFYIGNTDSIVRWKYTPGQTQLEGKGEKIASVPGAGYREHWTRNVILSPDGSKVYVTVGSKSNVDEEPSPRATILEMNPDGSGAHAYVTGTRNPIGLLFHSATGKLWAAVQERDRMGDDLPPDYVTELRPNGFYGWPYAYIGPHADPRRKEAAPSLVESVITPDVLIQAHSAVLGLVEVTGAMFPPEYRGDLLLARHGSWNRSKRTGYDVVRIPMQNGKPKGGYDDFVSGWMLGEDRREVWGRPVGLLMLEDGSLLIADDGGTKIWRMTYAAP
jgi:glucose/arabinose dehydrogenase